MAQLNFDDHENGDGIDIFVAGLFSCIVHICFVKHPNTIKFMIIDNENLSHPDENNNEEEDSDSDAKRSQESSLNMGTTPGNDQNNKNDSNDTIKITAKSIDNVNCDDGINITTINITPIGPDLNQSQNSNVISEYNYVISI